MGAFLDNDAACKLAGYDLFSDFLEAHQLAPLNVVRRSQIREYFQLKGKVLSAQLQDVAHKKALLALFNATSPPKLNMQAISLNSTLVTHRNMDVGEAQLIAYTSTTAGTIFVTGDKKALRVLANTPALASVAQSMAGRCVHLEQIIARVMLNKGIGPVRAKILARPGVDTALRRYMEAASDVEALTRLQQSIAKLRNETGALLVA